MFVTYYPNLNEWGHYGRALSLGRFEELLSHSYANWFGMRAPSLSIWVVPGSFEE